MADKVLSPIFGHSIENHLGQEGGRGEQHPCAVLKFLILIATGYLTGEHFCQYVDDPVFKYLKLRSYLWGEMHTPHQPDLHVIRFPLCEFDEQRGSVWQLLWSGQCKGWGQGILDQGIAHFLEHRTDQSMSIREVGKYRGHGHLACPCQVGMFGAADTLGRETGHARP